MKKNIKTKQSITDILDTISFILLISFFIKEFYSITQYTSFLNIATFYKCMAIDSLFLILPSLMFTLINAAILDSNLSKTIKNVGV